MPVRSHLRATPVASRRTALGCGILALTAVSGCDLALDGEGSGEPADATPSDGPDPQATAPAAGDPDTVLVDEVLAELGSMVDLVTAAAAGSAGLRVPLTALRELHLAHAAALQADPDSSSTSGATPSPTDSPTALSGGAGATRARVTSRERRLQRRLADWSVAADSGALARLLASMSAAVAQHVVHHLGEDPVGSTAADPTGGGAG